MTTQMRKTGIDVVGEMPWGTHFCLFYETKDDLLGTLVPYCTAGLEAEEFCLWVVSEPVSVDEAKHALRGAVSDLDRHLAEHSLEIASARDWYLQGGTFDLKRVIGGWNEELAERGVERTSQLTAASEALRQAQAQLAHVTRVTTLGEVAASLAHEVNQPLAAIVNNANACLGLLPSGGHLDEVRAALA